MNHHERAISILESGYQYAEDVDAGRITACKSVRKAVERWFNDCMTAEKRGLVFDEQAVIRLFVFYTHCKHYQGEWAGREIIPEPWQAFILMNLFGWYWVDGGRRFHTAYIRVARKNGKTTFVSPLPLYMMNFDGEKGVEVYSAATKKDQARKVWQGSAGIIRQNKKLQGKNGFKVRDSYVQIVDRETGLNVYQPLSKDTNSQDGLNPYLVVIDELHAHKTSEQYDVIVSAFGARQNWMLVSITTAHRPLKKTNHLQAR